MANSHTSVFLFNSKYGSYNGFGGSMTRAAKRRRSQAIYKKNWRIYKRAAFQSTINNMFSLKKGLTMAGCLTIGNSFRIVPGSGRCLETYRKLLMGFLFRWRDNLYDVKSFFFSRAEKRSSSGQLVALPSVVPCFIALLTHKSIFSHIRKGLRAKVESVWPPNIKHSNCAWMSNLSRMEAFYQHK